MPWYQPGAVRGYTKFYDESSDPDREDRFIVSDAFLAGLVNSYRQAYANAGGPNVEDTDALILDVLAQAWVTSNTDAAALGTQAAEADLAAGQAVEAAPGAYSTPGQAIPAQTETYQEQATIYARSQPQGQTTGTSGVAQAPSSATSGPAGTRPREGLSPTSPQQAAGSRMEPPPSLACAKGTMPAATQAAVAPLEPPGMRSRSQGLRVGPWSSGSVVAQ